MLRLFQTGDLHSVHGPEGVEAKVAVQLPHHSVSTGLLLPCHLPPLLARTSSHFLPSDFQSPPHLPRSPTLPLNMSSCSNKDAITLERLREASIWMITGPREMFTGAEVGPTTAVMTSAMMAVIISATCEGAAVG